MTYKAALASALVVLGLAGAEPALAQYMDDLMPPGAVIRLVRVSGFEPVSRPVLQGRRWVVSAVDPVGTNVRIVVDAEVGEIISARPLDPHAPRYHPGSRVIVNGPNGRSPRIANIPPGTEDVPPPAAPGAGPNMGVAPNPPAPAHAPSAARPATPSAPVQGRTPLPRSRPVESATISPEPAPGAKPGASEPAKTATPSDPAKTGPTGEAEHAGPVSTPAGASGGDAAPSPGTAQPAAAGAAPSGKQTASAPPKPAPGSKPAAPVLPPVQALEE